MIRGGDRQGLEFKVIVQRFIIINYYLLVITIQVINILSYKL